jgi:hypothetical protein
MRAYRGKTGIGARPVHAAPHGRLWTNAIARWSNGSQIGTTMYSVHVQPATFTREYPNWPIAYAEVTITGGDLAGVILKFEVYRICDTLRAVLPSQKDYVISEALQDQIVTEYRTVGGV